MDFYVFLDLFTLLSPMILLGGVLVGGTNFKRLTFISKLLTLYLFVMLVLDLLSRVCGYIFETNLVFIPILGFSELFIFSILFYFLGFRDSGNNKFLLFLAVAVASAFSIWEVHKISTTTIANFQSYSKAIDTFLIVLLSLVFFITQILMRREVGAALFSLVSGILIFFSLNLIIFLPIDFLVKDNTGLKFYFWFANLVFTLIFYVFLIRWIWKNGRIRD